MSNKHKIMLVDDDPDLRLLLQRILESEGYGTFSATCGTECLEQVAAVKPDLILLDVVMPEADGFAVCRQLKALPESMEIPVVFITGLDRKEEILKGFDAGGIDYITKPFDEQITLARINAVLSCRQLMKDKENLLEMNTLLLNRVETLLQELLQELLPDEGIVRIKEEVSLSIAALFDVLETLKEHVDKARVSLGNSRTDKEGGLFAQFESLAAESQELLEGAQMSLQFGDRMVQQFNEIRKTAEKINALLSSGDTEIDKSIAQSSSKSVLKEKTPQDEIDSLLNSLKN